MTRIARNLAQAFENVHRLGHVVGDVNEANVLARRNGTVLIIDADSFQIRSGGHVFPCLVGRPEYTPAELFRADLRRTVRVAAHDDFSLAVLLFRIFFHGRHPFDGVDPVVQSLEDRICFGRFPYAAKPPPGVQPPADVAYAKLPRLIAELFESAFVDGHQRPYARPSALAWAQALRSTELNLIKKLCW